MSSSNLVRWGGPAAMLGGVAFILDGLLGLPNKDAQFLDAIFIVALVFILVGLVGFHALQGGSYGRIGRAGFYTVEVATLAQILGLVALLSGNAALEWLIPIGSLAVLVGFVLYGAATLWARVLPRWCGVGFIVGLPVTMALGEIWGFVVFGLFWLVVGYTLWSRRDVPVRQPASVS